MNILGKGSTAGLCSNAVDVCVWSDKTVQRKVMYSHTTVLGPGETKIDYSRTITEH